jgi:hypothetical protein
MFILIVAAIINSTYAQTAAPVQKPTVEQKQVAPKETGSVNYENYVDALGNVKKRGFRYSFQYKDEFKPVKPAGATQKETYVKPSGDLGQRSYKYGFQYQGAESEEKPIKLKAPKLATPTEPLPGSGESSEPSSSSSSESAPSRSSSSAASASPLAPSSDDIKKKDAEILGKMKDLIKERQQLQLKK